MKFYGADWNRKPPGMVWEDWQAWQPWMETAKARSYEWAYDVELYTQGLPVGETDPALLKMWARNTAKRIDAVGRIGDLYDIFEARRITGWSAIAQVLGYRDLWLMQFPTLNLGELWIITERIDDTHRALAQRHGVRTWVVGEPSPQ